MALPRYGTTNQPMPVLDSLSNGGDAPWVTVTPPEEAETVQREISEPERARTIVANNRLGVLSVTVGEQLMPLGFAVPYALEPSGAPLLGIRTGVAQAAQLSSGRPVSLTVAETPLTANHAASGGGVTLLGGLQAIPAGSAAFDAAIIEYSRTQPADSVAIRSQTGKLFRLSLNVVLLSTSTEAIATVTVGDYSAASADPLSAVAPGLVSHLSNEQGGTLVLLCRAFGGQPNATGATLAGIDQFGMDLMVTTPQGRESVRLNFSKPVSTSEEVRRELNVMARGARFKLGVG